MFIIHCLNDDNTKWILEQLEGNIHMLISELKD